MTGAADLTGAHPGLHIVNADLSGARLREVDLSAAELRGVLLTNARIDGDITGLVVNGVRIEPLVRAELDRQFPERALLRAGTTGGLWDAATRMHELWDQTIDRIRALTPDQRNQRVSGEWSALETLRHLVFVHDAWFRRAVLGLQHPFHPIGLAPEWMPHTVEMGLVPSAPDLAAIETVWADQYIELLDYLDEATDDDLDEPGVTTDEPGWPQDPTQTTRLRGIHVVLAEQWEHRRFCERDLDELAVR